MSDEQVRKRRKLSHDTFYENCFFLENGGNRANDRRFIMDGYFMELEGKEMLHFFEQFGVIYSAFVDRQPYFDGQTVGALLEKFPCDVHVDAVIRYVENLLSEHNEIVIAAVSNPGQGDMDETTLISCLEVADPLPILSSYRKLFIGCGFWVSRIENLRQYFKSMGKELHSVVLSDKVHVSVVKIIEATFWSSTVCHFLNGSRFDCNWSILNLEGYSVAYDLVFSMVSHRDVVKFSAASKYSNYIVHGLDSYSMLMNRSLVKLSLLVTKDQYKDGHSDIRLLIDRGGHLETVFSGFSFEQLPFLSLVGVCGDLLVLFYHVDNVLAYYNTRERKFEILELPCVGNLVIEHNSFGVGCYEGEYVICLVQKFDGDCERNNVFIYSFNGRAWTNLSFNAVVARGSGVYARGKFFYVEDGPCPGILAVDVVNMALHTFRVMKGAFRYVGIGSIWGEVFVVELHRDCIRLRVMDSWSVTLRTLWTIKDLLLIHDCRQLKPVMFLADGSMLFLKNRGSFVAYCSRLKKTSFISEIILGPQDVDCYSYSGAFFTPN